MPSIPTYQPEVAATSPLPNVFAEPDSFGAGRALEGLGDEVSRAGAIIQQSADRSDLAAVRIAEAGQRAWAATELQKRANEAPAGDDAPFDSFLEEFQNRLSVAGEQFNTSVGRQAWRQSHAELTASALRAAMDLRVQSAGARAKIDYESALNLDRNTLTHAPNQLGAVLKSTLAALDDPRGPYAGMPAAAREALKLQAKQDLALSAFDGTARRDPRGALQQLDSGTWDALLDANKMRSARAIAEAGIAAQEAEAARVVAARNRADANAEKAAMDDFVRKWATDPTSVSALDIANSAMSPSTKLSAIEMIKRANSAGEKIATDPDVFQDVFARIHLPDGDPRKIKDENDLNGLLGEGLTFNDIQILRGEIAGRQTPAGETEAALKKSLVDLAQSELTGTNALLNIRDPKGDAQMQQFLSVFLPEYDRQRKEGKTALQLLSPDSPDYLGKLIAPLKRSPQQMMQDLIAGADIMPSGAALLAPAAAAPVVAPETLEIDGAARPVEQTKVVNGVKYFRVGGQWYSR